jgi:HPt (histidine-containing phosphotransfer) domain-containing protein
VRDATIPIVALTADAVSGDRERCLAVGMNDYVSKPVEPRHLAEVLAKWLPRERPKANAPVLDGEALVRRLMGDRELAGQVVRGFLEDVPRQLSALKRCLAERDAVEIRRCAHTLKGGSATIAAERLRPVCQAMEAAAASGDVEAAAALLGDVEKQVELLEETFALQAVI